MSFASAGVTSPRRRRTISPGTRAAASTSAHFPSRSARALRASAPFLECRERVGGLVFLPESKHSVKHQKQGNNREIAKILDEKCHEGGRLDHPRNRSPEESEKNGQFAFLFFLKSVRPVLAKPILRLRARETGFGINPELLKHLRDCQMFEVSLDVWPAARGGGFLR